MVHAKGNLAKATLRDVLEALCAANPDGGSDVEPGR
jgi:hypothetical protein